MNRVLILPGVATLLVFVAILAAERNPAEHSVGSSVSERPLLDVSEIQDRLVARWGELEGSDHAFSRIMRPRKKDYRIEILVDQKCEPPHATFAGSIKVFLDNKNFPGLSLPAETALPLLVDRYTGNCLVFKDGAWQDFESWAVASF